MSTSRRAPASHSAPVPPSSDQQDPDSSFASGSSLGEPNYNGNNNNGNGNQNHHRYRYPAEPWAPTDGPESRPSLNAGSRVGTPQPPSAAHQVPSIAPPNLQRQLQPRPPSGAIPGSNNRPATPLSLVPLSFQPPSSPIHPQDHSSPSAPPSILPLPVSPSLLPHHHTPYLGNPNPYRVGIAPPSPLLRHHFGPSSPRPGSPFSAPSLHLGQLFEVEHVPSVAHRRGSTTPDGRQHFVPPPRDDDIDDIDDEDDAVLRDSKHVLVLPTRPNHHHHHHHHYPPHHLAGIPLHHSYSHPRPLTRDDANTPVTDPHSDRRFSQSAGPGSRSPQWLRQWTTESSPLARHHSHLRPEASFIALDMRLGMRQPPSIAGSVAGASINGDAVDYEPVSSASAGHRHQHMVPADDMKRVIDEAERLNSELKTLMTNLHARQEESDHIHSLLVERAERAAQRIIFLQERVRHLEEELDTNDSELQNLRIQLKAIEIQCPPPDALDPDLRQSIENWKADWVALRRKRAARAAAASAAATSSFYRHVGDGDGADGLAGTGEDVGGVSANTSFS